MMSKEWLNRIEEKQNKYEEIELIKNAIQENIPKSWKRDFESFNGTKKIKLKEVKIMLQKIERCENLDKLKNTQKLLIEILKMYSIYSKRIRPIGMII